MFDIYHVRYKKIIFTEEMRTDKRFLESMNSIASILVLKKKIFIRKTLWKLNLSKTYIHVQLSAIHPTGLNNS